jgi:hypothetical protein
VNNVHFPTAKKTSDQGGYAKTPECRGCRLLASNKRKLSNVLSSMFCIFFVPHMHRMKLEESADYKFVNLQVGMKNAGIIFSSKARMINLLAPIVKERL